MSKIWPAAAAALVCYVLLFSGLSAVGLLGPDEPRYASIGREMARSGDWLTPRLWGQPWFEKPPLLYWVTGLAFRLGSGEELAPRLPVAVLSAAFLLFYYLALRREFGASPAFYATAILATSAGWLAFSRIGVTDLPMTAAFSAAMLLSIPWVARGERRGLAAAAALLGAAVLAKGLVPLVLALPVLWIGRRRWRDVLRPGAIAAFVVVAVPWYAMMTLRHGSAFLEEFFVRHHFGRVLSLELQHPQPFWFYVPVLLGLLFPWTPLAALLIRRKLYVDARARLLVAWLGFGLLFFSISVNKLPGYALPLIPPLAALAGLALAEARGARWALAGCGVLLAAIPAAAELLPAALLHGITRTRPGLSAWPYLAAALLVALAAWVFADRRRAWAVGSIVFGVTAGVVLLQIKSFPALDEQVSVRAFWRANAALPACVEGVDREKRYGLSYYAGGPLPECEEDRRQFRISESPEGRLVVTRLSRF